MIENNRPMTRRERRQLTLTVIRAIVTGAVSAGVRWVLEHICGT